MPSSLQETPTGRLLDEYREVLLALGANRDRVDLSRRATEIEAEINRRLAW